MAKNTSPLSHNYTDKNWNKLKLDYDSDVAVPYPQPTAVFEFYIGGNRGATRYYKMIEHIAQWPLIAKEDMSLDEAAEAWDSYLTPYSSEFGTREEYLESMAENHPGRGPHNVWRHYNYQSAVRDGFMSDHYVAFTQTYEEKTGGYSYGRDVIEEKTRLVIAQHNSGKSFKNPVTVTVLNRPTAYTVFDQIVRSGGIWYVADYLGREYPGTRAWYNPYRDFTVPEADRGKEWLKSLRVEARTDEEFALKYDIVNYKGGIELGGRTFARVGTNPVRFEINGEDGNWYWQEKLTDWQLLSIDEKDQLLQNLVIAGISQDDANRIGADVVKSREFLNDFFDEAAHEFRKEQRQMLEDGGVDREDNCLLATAQERQDGDCFEARLEKALQTDFGHGINGVPPIILETINEKEPLTAEEKARIDKLAEDTCNQSLDNPLWVQYIRDEATQHLYGSGGRYLHVKPEQLELEAEGIPLGSHLKLIENGKFQSEAEFKAKMREFPTLGPAHILLYEKNVQKYLEASGYATGTGTLSVELCKKDVIYRETTKLNKGLSKRALKLRQRLQAVAGPENADIIAALQQEKIKSKTIASLLSDKGKRAELTVQFKDDAALAVSDELRAEADESKRSRLAGFSELAFLCAMTPELANMNSGFTYTDFSYLRNNSSGRTIASLAAALSPNKRGMMDFTNAQLSALVPLFRLFRINTTVGNHFALSDESKGRYASATQKLRMVDEVKLQGQNNDPSTLLSFGRSSTLGFQSFNWTFDADYDDIKDRMVLGTLSLYGDSLTVFDDPSNNYNKLLDVDEKFKAVVGWHIPQIADRKLFTAGDLEAIRQSHIHLKFYFTIPTFSFQDNGSFTLDLQFRAAVTKELNEFDLLRGGPEGLYDKKDTLTKAAGTDENLGMDAINQGKEDEALFREYIKARQATVGQRTGTDVFGREAQYIALQDVGRTGWENRTDKYRNFRKAGKRFEGRQTNRGNTGYSAKNQKMLRNMRAGKAYTPRDIYGNMKKGEAKRALTDAEIEQRVEQINLKMFLNGAFPGKTPEAVARREKAFKQIIDFVATASGNTPGTPGSTGILKASDFELAYSAMDSFSKVNNPRKNALYSLIWKGVEDAGRMFYTPVKPSEIEAFLASMQLATQPAAAEFFKNSIDPATAMGAPEMGVDALADQLRNRNIYSVNTNFVDAGALASTAMQLLTAPPAGSQMRDFREQGCHLMFFTYLGDILQSMFKLIGREMSLERIRMVFGTIYYKDYYTKGSIGIPRTRELPLVDIPISKELFMAWFHRNYVAKPTDNIPVGNFMKKIMNTLIRPYLTGEMMNFVSDNEKIDPNVFATVVSSDKKINFGEIDSNVLESLLFPGAYAANSIPYSYIAYSGDLTKTARNGRPNVHEAKVKTLSLGRSRGLLKKAEFTRMKMPDLEADLVRHDGAKGIDRLKLPYTADVEMVGNNYFLPGEDFYLIPTIPGANAAAIAGRLGLGGQYMAQAIENTLSREGWKTEFKAINVRPSGHVTKRVEDALDQQNLAIAKKDQERVSKEKAVGRGERTTQEKPASKETKDSN